MDNTNDVTGEVATPTDSSSVNNNTKKTTASNEEATTGKKVLGREPGPSTDWDSQPESAKLVEETSVNKKEVEVDDAPTEAQIKKNEGLKKANEKLLDELKALREEKRALKESSVSTTNDDTIDAEIITPEEESEKILEKFIDKRLAERELKNNFYGTKSDFYSGETGEKNRQLVEEYVKMRFNTKNLSPEAINDLREATHLKFFGGFEQDAVVRQAKKQAKSEQLMNELAAMGSDKGKTVIQPMTVERKRILPIRKNPQDWY